MPRACWSRRRIPAGRGLDVVQQGRQGVSGRLFAEVLPQDIQVTPGLVHVAGGRRPLDECELGQQIAGVAIAVVRQQRFDRLRVDAGSLQSSHEDRQHLGLSIPIQRGELLRTVLQPGILLLGRRTVRADDAADEQRRLNSALRFGVIDGGPGSVPLASPDQAVDLGEPKADFLRPGLEALCDQLIGFFLRALTLEKFQLAERRHRILRSRFPPAREQAIDLGRADLDGCFRRCASSSSVTNSRR